MEEIQSEFGRGRRGRNGTTGSSERKPRVEMFLGRNEATGKVDSAVILTRI